MVPRLFARAHSLWERDYILSRPIYDIVNEVMRSETIYADIIMSPGASMASSMTLFNGQCSGPDRGIAGWCSIVGSLGTGGGGGGGGGVNAAGGVVSGGGNMDTTTYCGGVVAPVCPSSVCGGE